MNTIWICYALHHYNHLPSRQGLHIHGGGGDKNKLNSKAPIWNFTKEGGCVCYKHPQQTERTQYREVWHIQGYYGSNPYENGWEKFKKNKEQLHKQRAIPPN